MLRIEAYNNELPLEDIGSISGLIQKQMDSIGSPKTPEQIEQTLSNIFWHDSRAILFVGYKDDIPASFAFGNISVGLESGGDYFWLNELYVDTAYRRYGHAGELLSFIDKWLKNKGTKYMACVTGKDNSAAQNMYKKHGFDLGTIVWADKSI